jgi:hypothetical protein
MNNRPRLDRAAPRVALVTCAQVPELDADSRRLLGPLAERGVAAAPVVWDDPTALCCIWSTGGMPKPRPAGIR